MAEKKRAIFSKENFVDITLYQLGSERCDALHSFGPAEYRHFIFHYILSGKGELHSTDSMGKAHKYHLQEGQGFLIWPGQTNTYIADKLEPWHYTWVEFDGLRAKELITRSGLTFDNPVYVAQNPREREIMEAELIWLNENSAQSPLKIIGHMYLFLDALINGSSSKREGTSGGFRDSYVREALDYIGQHYAEEITVQGIADYCNISRNYLGKVFRGVFDESPQEFIMRYRINKACELMQITDRSIGEISLLVGYPNPLNFSRTFKSKMGMSPRQWRGAMPPKP